MGKLQKIYNSRLHLSLNVSEEADIAMRRMMLSRSIILESMTVVYYNKKMSALHKNNSLINSLSENTEYFTIFLKAHPGTELMYLLADNDAIAKRIDTDHRGDCYVFEVNGKEKSYYVEPHLEDGDIIMDTFIFDNLYSRDKMLLQIKMMFSGWSIK